MLLGALHKRRQLVQIAIKGNQQRGVPVDAINDKPWQEVRYCSELAIP